MELATITRDALGQALAGARRVSIADGTSVELAAPVILDLDGKGVQTLSQEAGLRFDLDGDGLADRTSWIGTTEGFLFLDRDGDGTLSDAKEFSFIDDLPGATSDLEGLRMFDSSGDGFLSAADKRFPDFRVWQDKNSNGTVDAGEVQTFTGAGVRTINLTATAYTGVNAAGDTAVVAKGSYVRTNGTTMDLLDAALTYVSAPRDGLPAIAGATSTFDGKASKYRVRVKDGQISVARKKGGDALDSRAGGLVGSVGMSFKDKTIGMLSALVLDLDGDGVSLTKASRSNGWFDMNGDGSPDQQGWASRRDGFLVIDRNANGRIDNASELSFLAEDATAKSSLAGLAKLDSNEDKLIDKSDARFGELRVWVDANGNGVTDASELKSLVDLGIKSVGLDARNLSKSVKPGQNVLISTATFTYENGTVRTLGDAALAFRPSEPPSAAAVVAPVGEPATGPDPALPSPAQVVLPSAAFFGNAAEQFATAMSSFEPSASGFDLDTMDPTVSTANGFMTPMAAPSIHG